MISIPKGMQDKFYLVDSAGHASPVVFDGDHAAGASSPVLFDAGRLPQHSHASTPSLLIDAIAKDGKDN
eukprot:6629358-Karenia_brevis.AAC.1